MNHEAKRIAIAKSDGWSHIHNAPDHNPSNTRFFYLAGKMPDQSEFSPHDDAYTAEVPNYLGDLNAIHSAVRSLPSELQWAWFAELAAIVDATSPASLGTAEQWSEAYLKTIGLRDA